ncbi:Uncharacterised protein [Serratia quinivorans]|nr:Uncharacterised protein [Serratia quinivorans]
MSQNIKFYLNIYFSRPDNTRRIGKTLQKIYDIAPVGAPSPGGVGTIGR